MLWISNLQKGKRSVYIDRMRRNEILLLNLHQKSLNKRILDVGNEIQKILVLFI